MNDDQRRAEAERAWDIYEPFHLEELGTREVFCDGYLAGDAAGYARGQAAERLRWRGNFSALRAYLTTIEFKIENLGEEVEKMHAAIDEELRQIALLDTRQTEAADG